MKIIIEGSPKEIAELLELKVQLNNQQIKHDIVREKPKDKTNNEELKWS